MIEKVKLRIETPDSNCLELEANGVIIPAAQGDITILSERAPSVFSLDYGVVQLLNADLKVKDKYYITSGAADEGVCEPPPRAWAGSRAVHTCAKCKVIYS